MGKLKLTERKSIVQFIENSIDNQEMFFLWVSDEIPHKRQTNGLFSIKMKKMLPNNSIKIVIMNSSSKDVERLLSIKNINLKHTDTGLFFRTLLKKTSDGSLSIPIPKLLNFTNTRDKNRNEISPENRIKFTGTKKTTYEEIFKFTGNILDFHFHGMAVHLSNQYISQISVGDCIEITKIHTENLKQPAIAEIRYITKEKVLINDVKQIFYKVGLYIKEKLPAETIFALTKFINKKAS